MLSLPSQKQVSDLQAKISEYAEQLEQEQRARAEAEEQMAGLQSQLEASKGSNRVSESTQKEIDDLKAKLLKRKDQKAELKREIDDQKQQNVHAIGEIANTQSDVAKLHKLNEQLQISQKQKETENAQLEAQIALTNTEHAAERQYEGKPCSRN